MYKLDTAMLGPKKTSNSAPQDPSILVCTLCPHPCADQTTRNMTPWVSGTTLAHTCPDLLHSTAPLSGVSIRAEAGPRVHVLWSDAGNNDPETENPSPPRVSQTLAPTTTPGSHSCPWRLATFPRAPQADSTSWQVASAKSAGTEVWCPNTRRLTSTSFK